MLKHMKEKDTRLGRHGIYPDEVFFYKFGIDSEDWTYSAEHRGYIRRPTKQRAQEEPQEERIRELEDKVRELKEELRISKKKMLVVKHKRR